MALPLTTAVKLDLALTPRETPVRILKKLRQGMQLEVAVEFHPESNQESLLESFPPTPAVFALFPQETAGLDSAPYLGRTLNLRRRLRRLLGVPGTASRMLNLRHITRRVEYQCVGSSFEAQWLLYLLHRCYHPRQYRQRLRLRPPVLLKLNLRNRFPRCYPTRRLLRDGSVYYGPFPSRTAAEHFAAEFLNFFKIRRCVEELDPHPSHPGCMYSQMRMCLAPCFLGCTDGDYQGEVARVVEFLDGAGTSLFRALEADRQVAAERLEFELAAKIHSRFEKVREVIRLKPDLVRNLRHLSAVMVQPGAQPRSIVLFRVLAGELRGPVRFSLDENVSVPVPLDQQLHTLLDPLSLCSAAPDLPPWEHLALLARWYYSSFREGELLMLPPSQEIPHAQLIRLCRRILAARIAPLPCHSSARSSAGRDGLQI